jgi:PhnB protein
MARTSTYLNFPRDTEAAFNFYRSVFGGDFVGGVHRFKDMPAAPGQPPLAEADRELVMHVELHITGGHALMGTDAPESMGFHCKPGNNVYINLEPDTRAETERLFSALAAGGTVGMPLQDMFWGAYFGSCADRFGVNWMVNCANAPQA